MTRTFHLGEPTQHQKMCFTRVLQVMRHTTSKGSIATQLYTCTYNYHPPHQFRRYQHVFFCCACAVCTFAWNTDIHACWHLWPLNPKFHSLILTEYIYGSASCF